MFYNPARARPTPAVDQSLIWFTLLLLAFGFVMVYSASLAIAEADESTGFRGSYFLVRHGVYLATALAAAFTIFRIPMSMWQQLAPYLFVAGAIALVLVLIPGLGREVNGS